MGTENQEEILTKVSKEFWHWLEIAMDAHAEDMVQEHLADYLEGTIPQEVLDLAEIYDTYLKESVINQIQEAQNEFMKALCLRTLLSGLGTYGYKAMGR